jgi:hypothetical protein
LLSPYRFLNENRRPEVVRLGELERDRRKIREGLTWIAAHPLHSRILLGQHALISGSPPGTDFYFEAPRVLIWPYVLARSILTLLALAGGLPPAPPRASVAQINRSGFVIVPVDLLHRQLVLAYQMLIYWVLVLLAGVAIGAIYDLFLARCRLATRVPLTQGEGGHRRIPLRDGKWLARSSGRKRRKRVGSARA